MIVCHCHGITDRDICGAGHPGESRLGHRLGGLNGGGGCGSCTRMIQSMLVNVPKKHSPTE